MLRTGSRKIELKKKELLRRIRANKKEHLIMYKDAVQAYKEEAKKQLDKLNKDLLDGKMDLSLNLIRPIDNSDNYDDIYEMFKWDERDILELDQNEFREYVLDDNANSNHIKMTNSSYLTYN